MVTSDAIIKKLKDRIWVLMSSQVGSLAYGTNLKNLLKLTSPNFHLSSSKSRVWRIWPSLAQFRLCWKGEDRDWQFVYFSNYKKSDPRLCFQISSQTSWLAYGTRLKTLTTFIRSDSFYSSSKLMQIPDIPNPTGDTDWHERRRPVSKTENMWLWRDLAKM